MDQHAQREANPRHYDGPGLHAAMPVDSLFERRQLKKLPEIEFQAVYRLRHLLKRSKARSRTSWNICAGSLLSVPNS